MRKTNEQANETNYFWIAVNGASAALSPYPLPTKVKCTPRPQVLIGIEDGAEARAIQRVLLTAPLPQVKEQIETLRKRKDIIYRQMDFPQRPSEFMAWSVQGGHQ
jgi:hypothetical protein